MHQLCPATRLFPLLLSQRSAVFRAPLMLIVGMVWAWFCLVVAVLMTLCRDSHAEGVIGVVNRQFGFEVSYSGRLFEEREAETSGVALILGSREGGFPTFTVAVNEGAYRPRSGAEHADTIVNEYRRVGFKDAQLVDVFRYVHRGVRLLSPQVVMLFTNADLYLRAKVVCISTPSRHFLLTYMDYADRDDDGESERLFSGFRVVPVQRELRDGGQMASPLASSSGERVEDSVLDEVAGWVSGLVEGVAGRGSDDDAIERDHIAMSVDDRYDFGEAVVDPSEYRARPSFSRLPALPLPTTPGGKLLSMLMLFTAAVVLSRLRRG